MATKTVIEDMPITYIDLDVTNNCILNCDYCFRSNKNKQSLSWEVGTRAIDFLIQHSWDADHLTVVLFGGEPLLEFNLIKNLVPWAEQTAAYHGKSIQFRAVTNCVLVNDEIIKFFRWHGMGFITSIDGDAESHDKHRHFPDGTGSHAIIEPKIKQILKCWPNTCAKATISPDTVHRMFKDVLHFIDKGYINIGLEPIIEGDWTEEHFECLQGEMRKISNFYIERFRSGKPITIKLLEESIQGIIKPSRPRYSCGAGRYSILVKTDGTIYPCGRFAHIVDTDSSKHWNLGSIFEGIDKEKRKVFLNYDNISQTKADCENCLAVHTCKVWCMAANWYCCQDINKPHSNMCRFTNIHFAEAMRIHYILHSENNQAFMNKFYADSQQRQNEKTMQNSVKV